MTDDQIATIAEGALRPLLGPHGLESVEAQSGQDHDGDAALFLAARYRAGSEVPGGEVLLQALGAVHDALRSAGEGRFPYLDHRFSEEGFEDEDEAHGGAESP